MRSAVRFGVATLAGLAVLLGATGCGDDGGDGKPGELGALGDEGDGGAGGGEAGALPGEDGGADGHDLDLCSLLEAADVEAQFGANGAVAEGSGGGIICSWAVGDQSQLGLDERVGDVSLTDVEAPGGTSVDVQLDGLREASEHTREVAGVGDEAVLSDGFAIQLTFRSGGALLSLSANFFPAPEGTEDKLVALARQVVDRL